MAGRLIGAWNPALSSSGTPYSGALLTTYATGTTTPKATYTDATLTVFLPNPVQADSAGRFPEIWSADGGTYDLDWTTSGGVVIKAFTGIQALGATATGAVTRDFGADGRFNLEARGGTAYLEAGDPTPDNVGGKMRLGGWAGTQADLLTLDAAEVDLTGTLSVAAWKTNTGPSEALISSGAFTVAQATLDVALTGTFNAYRLVLMGIDPVTNNETLQARVSVDNGASYKAGSTDYTHSGLYSNSSGTSGHFEAATAAQISLQPTGSGNTTGITQSLDVTIFRPNGFNTVMLWRGWMADSSGNLLSFQAGARSVWSLATNIRLLYASGNVARAGWALFGLRGL